MLHRSKRLAPSGFCRIEPSCGQAEKDMVPLLNERTSRDSQATARSSIITLDSVRTNSLPRKDLNVQFFAASFTTFARPFLFLCHFTRQAFTCYGICIPLPSGPTEFDSLVTYTRCSQSSTFIGKPLSLFVGVSSVHTKLRCWRVSPGAG